MRELYNVRRIWRGNICLSLVMLLMTLATFIDIFYIWSFHVSFWSSVIPKKLKLVTCSTGLPLIKILSFGIVRGCLKNIMNFDLATFKRSLLLSSQVFTFDISLFNYCSKVLISFTGPKFSRCDIKVVSSAYIITLNFEVALGMSLIRMLKSSGPSTE